jgi:hypothetical protein
LGMHDALISPEQVQDPWEKNVPGLGLGRDPVRSPMPWSGEVHAGFSTVEPWLAGRPRGSRLLRAAARRSLFDALTLSIAVAVTARGACPQRRVISKRHSHGGRAGLPARALGTNISGRFEHERQRSKPAAASRKRTGFDFHVGVLCPDRSTASA